MYSVFKIEPETAQEYEKEIIQHVNKAFENGMMTMTAEEVFDEILEEYMQAWAVVLNDQVIGVCVTEILSLQTHFELFVVAVAGENFEAYKNELDCELTKFAQLENCLAIRSVSRRGMVKALKNLNYKEDLVVMRKSLMQLH